MLKLTLVDSQDSVEYSLLQVPFTIQDVVGETDVTTLSGDVYSDYLYQKKSFKHKWAWMNNEDFNRLRGFYDRQFTNYKYPTMTLEKPDGTVITKVVKMDISSENIINDCGIVEGVEINLRETVQI